METHLPTPMTGRVELLIYQRVSLIGKTFVNSPRLNHQISRKNPRALVSSPNWKVGNSSNIHRTIHGQNMSKCSSGSFIYYQITMKFLWLIKLYMVKIWSKYGQNMVNMFHKHYQKLIVSWGNSSSTKHASSEIRIVTSSRRANTPWWFRKVRETELVCVPFLDKAMVNHVMWSNITTTSWKLSLSSCQSLNWQTWTWLGNDRSVIWTWGHNPSPNPINL